VFERFVVLPALWKIKFALWCYNGVADLAQLILVWRSFGSLSGNASCNVRLQANGRQQVRAKKQVYAAFAIV
jgi:hypothetical protein